MPSVRRTGLLLAPVLIVPLVAVAALGAGSASTAGPATVIAPADQGAVVPPPPLADPPPGAPVEAAATTPPPAVPTISAPPTIEPAPSTSAPVESAPSPVNVQATRTPPIFSGPLGTPGKVVYLTFDDGPTATTTTLLDLLARHRAKATFFALGNNVVERPRTAARAVREGHAVENHSWSHPRLTGLDWAAFYRQISKTNTAIKAATNDAPECLRAPYGAYDGGTLLRADRFGLRMIQWSVDSRDWSRPGAKAIVRNVLSNVRNGSIVLLHDGGGNRQQTIDAVRILLPELRERGYVMRALPQCAGA
jgi:peptidoglycan/xylan/chitin deacetylase (PgdA/CDA1 family)